MGGTGQIERRPIFCYAQDPLFLGGSLGEAHAATIVRVLDLAVDRGVPVVSFVESGGARIQEGVSALAGYGQIFSLNVALSGRVPQISVVTGVSAGGGSYSPALTDFVIMCREASMFLTGPSVVREALGEDTSFDALGGADVHAGNGVCHFVVEDDREAIALVRTLLSYLPPNAWSRSVRAQPKAATGADPGRCLPTGSRQGYDVGEVIRCIVDAGDLLEVSEAWAPNMVTAFARLDGRPIGIVANQPKHLAGVVDIEASLKAARFIRVCNSFGLPILTFVDTPGFMPGAQQERAGIIRRGANLLYAFAEATVPKLTVVLRKAFGGAYIAMNSKALGAHWTFAWPDAEIGIMSAEGAVGIVHRRTINSATDRGSAKHQLAAGYAAEHLSASNAARQGQIDEVIEPSATRGRLATALTALDTGTSRNPECGNLPL